MLWTWTPSAALIATAREPQDTAVLPHRLLLAKTGHGLPPGKPTPKKVPAEYLETRLCQHMRVTGATTNGDTMTGTAHVPGTATARRHH